MIAPSVNKTGFDHFAHGHKMLKTIDKLQALLRKRTVTTTTNESYNNNTKIAEQLNTMTNNMNMALDTIDILKEIITSLMNSTNPNNNNNTKNNQRHQRPTNNGSYN